MINNTVHIIANKKLNYFNRKGAETILIQTIMTRPPLVEANPSDSIFQISNLMKERKVSSTIIIDQNCVPDGIITERYCEEGNIKWQRS